MNCCKDSFDMRLHRATDFYVNILSDRTEEPDKSAFVGFGKSLMLKPPAGTPFYCKVTVSDNSVSKIVQGKVCLHSELDEWLFSTDVYAANNLREYKFRKFSGGKWISANGFEGYQIEVDFVRNKFY